MTEELNRHVDEKVEGIKELISAKFDNIIDRLDTFIGHNSEDHAAMKSNHKELAEKVDKIEYRLTTVEAKNEGKRTNWKDVAQIASFLGMVAALAVSILARQG